VKLSDGAEIAAPGGWDERAVYVLEGRIAVDGEPVDAGMLAILSPEASGVTALSDARFVMLGGAALDGPRTLWWNFVSSDKARLEAAKRDWAEGKFPRVPGDDEFIPLPER